MSAHAAQIDAYLAGIETLRQAVAGMTIDQLRARPISGKWSTLEVICHLVDSEQAWVHRMKRVIAEHKPLLIGYDERNFSLTLGYQERDPAFELNLFEQLRRQMGLILRGLPETAWERQGVHSEMGLVTLTQMVAIESEHAPHHVKFVHEKRKALGLPTAG